MRTECILIKFDLFLKPDVLLMCTICWDSLTLLLWSLTTSLSAIRAKWSVCSDTNIVRLSTLDDTGWEEFSLNQLQVEHSEDKSRLLQARDETHLGLVRLRWVQWSCRCLSCRSEVHGHAAWWRWMTFPFFRSFRFIFARAKESIRTGPCFAVHLAAEFANCASFVFNDENELCVQVCQLWWVGTANISLKGWNREHETSWRFLLETVYFFSQTSRSLWLSEAILAEQHLRAKTKFWNQPFH